jgi:hypothetical protein
MTLLTVGNGVRGEAKRTFKSECDTGIFSITSFLRHLPFPDTDLTLPCNRRTIQRTRWVYLPSNCRHAEALASPNSEWIMGPEKRLWFVQYGKIAGTQLEKHIYVDA